MYIFYCTQTFLLLFSWIIQNSLNSNYHHFFLNKFFFHKKLRQKMVMHKLLWIFCSHTHKDRKNSKKIVYIFCFFRKSFDSKCLMWLIPWIYRGEKKRLKKRKISVSVHRKNFHSLKEPWLASLENSMGKCCMKVYYFLFFNWKSKSKMLFIDVYYIYNWAREKSKEIELLFV